MCLDVCVLNPAQRDVAIESDDNGCDSRAAGLDNQIGPDERRAGDLPPIYRATRSSVNSPFGAPQCVVAAAGFVEAPTLSADGRSLYFHSKDGNRFVIYRASR